MYSVPSIALIDGLPFFAYAVPILPSVTFAQFAFWLMTTNLATSGGF